MVITTGSGGCCFLAIFLSLNLIIQSPPSTNAENFSYPSAVNPNVSWLYATQNAIDFVYGTGVRPVLANGNFVCGFHCRLSFDSGCFFAISILYARYNVAANSGFSIETVWSANRNHAVDYEAVLKFTEEGDLMLQDGKGASVWSTNTTAKSVSRLKLTKQGNLVLVDEANRVVWQSFDHPTDCLLPGQILVSGKKLRSSLSETNTSEGLHSLTIDDDGHLLLYAETDPPQLYYRSQVTSRTETGQYYVDFQSLDFPDPDTNSMPDGPFNSSSTHIKLGSDGHMRIYLRSMSSWNQVDILPMRIDKCVYPMGCGKYGFCTLGTCSCREVVSPYSGENTDHFQPQDFRQLDLGCSLAPPLACEFSRDQVLLPLAHHFINAFNLVSSVINNTYVDICKQACLGDCSCKALIFRQYSNRSTVGDCSLVSEVFSLGSNDFYYNNFYNSSIFLKVQNSPVAHKSREDSALMIGGSTYGSVFGLILVCSAFVQLVKHCSKKVEEGYLDQMPVILPTRFSYEELKLITNNFSNKLGEGGFGSVFQGTLPAAGVEVAVKHLDGIGRVNKSFITEVQTIGSIHHFNLVSLVGFCAENCRRLLVYEYMCNGSLDRWIFNRNKEQTLSWECRKKIILDIAKGLAYLHEECKHKIIHLDIKPQNILLDVNFNAKVSDFGLSKLMGRNQSQVVTTMRGTPGYMAPEWLSCVITEKVDVYSFGIVVLEILCGRKNVDTTQAEEDMHLVSVFKRMAKQELLVELVDKCSEDMQSNSEQVVKMMKVAGCCLQTESGHRPRMSMVVKVLEGSMEVENCLSYDVSNLPGPEAAAALSLTLPSILSGPR